MKLVYCLLLVTSFALAQTPDNLEVHGFYIPKGYDSNDEVEIILNSALPNKCYKYPKSIVSKTTKGFHIRVSSTYEPGESCNGPKIPFNLTVNLGKLNINKYLISVNSKTNKNGKTLNVDTPEKYDLVGNEFYAAVEYVKTSRDSRTIYLIGKNPSPCFKFDRVDVDDNGSNVYQIKPIVKYDTSSECPDVVHDFKYEVEVPNNLKVENPLLHIRIMDGRSINKIFPKYPL